MFLGSYYSKCLLNEIQGKPYNKTKVLITDIVQKIMVVSIILMMLISCEPIKPDYVDSKGREYMFTHPCVKSHTETEYGYHYGWNVLESKANWHWGMETKTICDSITTDTIEINQDKHFYAK